MIISQEDSTPTVERMDFDEPNLEELIQSDLHSEMNKILNQSDTEPCTSSDVKHIKTSQQAPSTLNNSCRNGDDICSSKVFDIQVTNMDKNRNEQHTFFDQSCLTPDLEATTTSVVNSELSGHFSVESYPSNNTENLSTTAPVKGEQSDLSNLAWLTSVDVQQTLQHVPPGNMLPENQSEICASHHNQQFLQENARNIPGSAQVSIPPRPRIAPRYTPIQPNPNTEGTLQRYMLQQRGTGQRTLLSMQDQYGAHGSYHPYPPPPYGNSGGYVHENYTQGRYPNQSQKVFPKPVYSYSCLIAMSLRNSKTGCLPVSDIYNFMMENFPYFKTAPDGWKNSVRHNLSLNKCFEKANEMVEKPNGSQRKGCLWALNPAKIGKMEEEVQKWKRKDPEAIRRSMSNPEELDRELEEIRRTDEEAARRRMLSMTTHGLSMITSQHGYHPYSRHGHHHSPHTRHLHPGGTSSMPTTPQHYHHHRTPYRQPMTPTHRVSSSEAFVYSGYNEEQNNHHTRQPRQLFTYPTDNQNFQLGAPEVSSTPNPTFKNGGIHCRNVTSQLPQCSSLSSPYSSSSSGNASFLGSLADTLANHGHDLNDIDLDSSLADLSAFQGPLWEDAASALTPHDHMSEATMATEPFDDSGGVHSQGHSGMDNPSVNVMDRVAVAPGSAPSDADVFGATTRFGGDMSYFNNNNKAVMLH